MTSAISYRGPDEDGLWADAEVGAALGHRRLSIVDLTPTGAQPMASANGRVIISYNGELFNAAEIAAELAVPLRGTSDTEVLVEAIARFGIDGALNRANGQFAFAAFDRSTRTLHLARDRLGIKPLYWTQQGKTFAFSSELKALRVLPDLVFSLDLEAVAAYMRHTCVPAPYGIFCNVNKLRPAHRLEVTASGAKEVCYWRLPIIAVAGQANRDLRGEGEIVDELENLLKDVVKRQIVSDVPVGAFLSGGIDSSTVVALMRQAASGPIKTFSIGFREQTYNEADDARHVAEYLETDHSELIVSAADTQKIIPMLPVIYDEPFADSSQLPTYLVSRLARQQVTVALSGDGGDENFGGYVRYQAIERLWNALRFVPHAARRFASSALQLVSDDAWDAMAQPIPRRLKPSHLGDKVSKASRLLAADGPLDMYQRLVAPGPDPELLLAGRRSTSAASRSPVEGLDTVGNLRLLDMEGYLPDDILTKVDRASMAVGLEVRVPLIDHRLVEFNWRLPSRTLIRNGIGKRPLRAVLSRYVPNNLINRPKMGFGVPVAQWLRGPLRDWSEHLLSRDALAQDGIFDADLVRQRLDEHLSGRRNWQHILWTVLQFQAWRQAYS